MQHSFDNDMRSFSTRRETVQELETLLYKTIQILDHGFIRVVDYMGSDSAIVQAARVSYGKGTKKVNEDQALINYLMRHNHSTPFEMCEIKLHIKLPIFVARQWVRHRTANINEYSARYSIASEDFYLPRPEHIMGQSLSNKQGRNEAVNQEISDEVQKIINDTSKNSYIKYMKLLDLGKNMNPNKVGIARELARITLNLNYYTEWYWKIDLNNLLHFLKLRLDANAQYEIRIYAEEISKILKKWVPLTHAAFVNYQKESMFLSKIEQEILKKIMANKKIITKPDNISIREWQEFLNKIHLPPEYY